jgi:hypothetical protein
MPPTSPMKMLLRLFFGRRNILPTEHIGPDTVTEARRVRLDAERKLAGSDELVRDAQIELWLMQQRRERERNGS